MTWPRLLYWHLKCETIIEHLKSTKETDSDGHPKDEPDKKPLLLHSRQEEGSCQGGEEPEDSVFSVLTWCTLNLEMKSATAIMVRR